MVYNYPPYESGVVAGFVSAFLWTPLFEFGPKVLIHSLITGCIVGFLARISHKEFETEKKKWDYEDQYTSSSVDEAKIL